MFRLQCLLHIHIARNLQNTSYLLCSKYRGLFLLTQISCPHLVSEYFPSESSEQIRQLSKQQRLSTPIQNRKIKLKPCTIFFPKRLFLLWFDYYGTMATCCIGICRLVEEIKERCFPHQSAIP